MNTLNQSLQAKFPHLEVSVLSLSEVKKDNESFRIDSEYFKKEYVENEEKIKSDKIIKDFVDTKIKSVKSISLNKNFNYLQISDVDLNNGLEYTTLEIYYKNIPDRATYVLKKNDICVSSVRPNRNAVALIKKSKRLVGTSGFTILRIDDKNILPEFLYIFCKTSFFITKMMRENTASLYPAVLNSDILKCKIPLLPMSFQLEIEAMVKDSHKALEQSKALYKEAENLLYESLGLDPLNPLDSILRPCHIAPCHSEASAEVSTQTNRDISPFTKAQYDKVTNSPCHTERSEVSQDSINKDISHSSHTSDSVIPQGQYDNAPNFTIKTLKESFLQTGRLDSEYYQVKYEKMESLIKSKGFKTLEEICSLINYGSVPTSPYSENNEGVPYIKGLNLKNLEITENKLDRITNTQGLDFKFFTKENDIIISQMGTVGDVGIVSKKQENYIFASFTIRIRLKNTEEFNPYFVALYIQNIAKEWYLHRNIAQASVRQNTDLPTIRNLYVPLVDKNIQDSIASQIQKSFALRAEAKNLLNEARAKVESAIGGGGK